MKRLFLGTIIAMLVLTGCSQPQEPASETTANNVGSELDDSSILFERVAGSSYADNDFFITDWDYETKTGFLKGVHETTYDELDNGQNLIYVKSDANGYVYKFDREVLGNRLEIDLKNLGQNTMYPEVDIINNILVISNDKTESFGIELKDYNESPYILISGGKFMGSTVIGNYYYILIMEHANSTEMMTPITVYRYSLIDKSIQSIGKVGDVGARGYPSRIDTIFKNDQDVYVRLFSDIYKVTDSVESIGVSFKGAIVSNIEFYNNNYYAILLEDSIYKIVTWDREWNRLETTEVNNRGNNDYADYADIYQIRIVGKQVNIFGQIATSLESREYRYYTYDINSKAVKHTQTISQ